MMSPHICFEVVILTLTTVLQIWAYQDVVDSQCLRNLLRLRLDGSRLAGRQVHVDVLNGSHVITITPFLAAQCGFSINSDPWGNSLLYISLQHCYAQTRGDGTFEVNLQLRPHRQHSYRGHTVSKTCSYPEWASREILCSHNYMEVSVVHDLPISEQIAWMMSSAKDSTSIESDSPSTRSPFRFQNVMVYAPAEKTFSLVQLQGQGYGLHISPTRLLIRGPHNTSATYFQDVAQIPMAILKSSVIYEYRWMLFLVKAAAACPAGGVSFTKDVITWRLPRHITPLLSSTSSEIIEAYMGIDGQRLDEAIITARGYSFYATDYHFVIEMPIGSPDGYYKSHVQEGLYHITYSIEPMVELLWRETGGSEETRYKALHPISTPPLPRPPHVTDYTVPEEGKFRIILGTFLPDVDLINITTGSAVMTVSQAAANGFDIQQHIFPNGSIAFNLEVPFTQPAVIKENLNVITTTYTLELGFVFLVLPEEIVFSHPAILETAVEDDLPSINGSCDQKYFYITVHYGSKGHNFDTLVGGSLLTTELAQQYSYNENRTHFTVKVPFGSPDIAFEVVKSSFVRGRIDVTLQDPERGWNISYYSRACSFFTSFIECMPNGTIEAIAIKVEAVPSLDLRQLSLNDPSCGPTYSDNHFALFLFRVDSCGTTREFTDGVMVYKNRASLKDETDFMSSEPKYRFTFSCEYSVNSSKTVAFITTPQSTASVADVGVGELMVQMRLAKDAQYTDFYSDGEYPTVRYLQQPLYFELELAQCKDPNVELVVDRCWATLHKDRTSKPQWNIIVDGCPNPEDPDQTIFHPVIPDARVKHTSLFKRFEVKMFSFAAAEDVAASQVVFHCDVVICDSTSAFNGLCHGQCATEQMGAYSVKRGPRSVSALHKECVSSGLIFLR